MNEAQTRAAVFDIGSNSIRYLSCEFKEGELDMTALSRRLITTRLAEGADTAHTLCDAAMERSVRALREFAALAKSEGAKPFAYATSAVRDAKNGGEFVARVKRELDIDVDVLTGAREASCAYLGAVGPTLDGARRGLIDIGGGSCQITTAEGGQSFPIGCVRAKELCARADAASAQPARDTLGAWREVVFSRCETLMRGFVPPTAEKWLGVGGSITTLAALGLGLDAFDESAVAEATLSRRGVDALIERLYAMGESRRRVPLLLERHDVIIFGALILAYIMQMLDMDELGISVRDGMEGYIMYLRDAFVV